MFQLIVGLIAIALFSALSAATLFYGGDVWTDGGMQADAAAVMAQSEQIHAAFLLYKTANGKYPDGVAPTTAPIDTLVSEGYLKAYPPLPSGVVDPSAWTPSWYMGGPSSNGIYIAYIGAMATSTDERKEQARRLCLYLNGRYGIDGIPMYAGSVAAALPGGSGCVEAPGSAKFIFFRKMY